MTWQTIAFGVFGGLLLFSLFAFVLVFAVVLCESVHEVVKRRRR